MIYYSTVLVQSTRCLVRYEYTYTPYLFLAVYGTFPHRYMDGYASQNVEVRHPNNSISPTLTICPSFGDSYKDTSLQVSCLNIQFPWNTFPINTHFFRNLMWQKKVTKREDIFLGMPPLKLQLKPRQFTRTLVEPLKYVVNVTNIKYHFGYNFRWLGILLK